MRLYIPEHLKKIPVINQLYRMYKEYITGTDEYGESYYKTEQDSFEDYRKYRSTDPVKRFITNWINEEELERNGMDKEAVIPYLVKLFYSLKGTPRVLDYLKKYMGLNMEYSYSISFLELNIKAGDGARGVKITDMNLFLADLKEFCNELLYFNEAKSGIDKIKINVVESVNCVVGSSYIPYQHWEATEVGTEKFK